MLLKGQDRGYRSGKIRFINRLDRNTRFSPGTDGGFQGKQMAYYGNFRVSLVEDLFSSDKIAQPATWVL
jgi:hypothetical protein